MMTALPTLAIEPLTRAAFARFGEVIEADGVVPLIINEGTTRRFHDLARIDTAAGGGHTIVSIFAATARPLPLAIRMLERHPLGSQAFVPLDAADWLVVVGEGTVLPDPESIRCFRASGQQGINYRPNCWHHPVLCLAAKQRFLVIDRDGPGNNLDEVWFDAADSPARVVEGWSATQ